MKPILILKDQDIFPLDFTHEPNTWEQTKRVAVRIIVIDKNNRIALCGTKFELLPGGGVEENETLEEAASREVLEEIGCKVKIQKYIGFTEETRDNGKRHQISHCFVTQVLGEKGAPQSTQQDELNMKVYWRDIEEALQILQGQTRSIPFQSYNSCFNTRISLAFVKEFTKQNLVTK